MIKAPRIAITLALLATAVAAQDRKPEHLLRLAFQKGKTTWSRVTNELTATIGRGDTPMEQKVAITVFFETKVQDVSVSGTRIVHRIYRMKYTSGVGDRLEFDYDSADDEAPPANVGDLTKMLGASFTLQVDDRGRVRKLEIPEAVAEIDRQSGVDFMTMTDLLLPRPPELPEGPVAAGAKWSGTPPEIAGEKYTTESLYELLAVTGGKAEIRHELVVRYADAKDEEKKKLGNQTTRVITLDLGRGRVVGVQGEVAIRTGERTGLGIEMTMAGKRTIEETDGKQMTPESDGKEPGKAPPPAATSRPKRRDGRP